MSNLDYDNLECSHTTENREKYDVIINDKNKVVILCKNCFDEYKIFSVFKISSDNLEILS